MHYMTFVSVKGKMNIECTCGWNSGKSISLKTLVAEIKEHGHSDTARKVFSTHSQEKSNDNVQQNEAQPE